MTEYCNEELAMLTKAGIKIKTPLILHYDRLGTKLVINYRLVIQMECDCVLLINDDNPDDKYRWIYACKKHVYERIYFVSFAEA